MSQVKIKKYATGGTFIIDGQEIKGTDAINAVRSHLGETTGGIMNALQDGATVNYNSGDNTVSIVDSNGNDRFMDYLPAGEKASILDSDWKKNWDATFNRNAHRFKTDLRKLRGIIIPSVKADNVASDLKILGRGSGWFYTKDENGNNVYQNGPLNEARLAAIRNIRGYLEGDDTFKKGYKTDGWKQSDIDALTNWITTPSVSTDRDAYWNGLIDRIQLKNGQSLTDQDIEVLRLMGFNDITDNADFGNGNNSGNSNKPTIDKNWIGNRDAAESAGIGIGKDSNGNWIITGENPYTSGTWYARGIPFLKGTPFETGAIHNGRLYTEGDVFGGKYGDLSAAMTPFISAFRDETSDWNTRWNNAYNSGVKWYDMDNNIYANAGDPTKGYSQYWTRYFTDNNLSGNYNMIDVSNAFNNLGNRQVVSYIDGVTKNRYGIDEPVYLVRNEDGTITKYDNYNQLLANSGLTENSDIYGFAPKDITINPYQNIRGREYAEYQRFGKNGQENTVLVGRDGYLYLDRGDAKPKRIYDIEKLKNILAGQAFENKELDAITLRPNAFWTSLPFERNSFNFSQQKTNRQEKKNPTKFQWGGAIQKVKSSAVSNDPSTKKHDYTKAHALDGSDGKLTDAEWMQIGAAAGDLAGVGISFVPGAGNILGATTGAAASTTKFIADIKQDGYQGKDLGNYLANLGLDAATLIPGLGTGTKAVKAARIIKGVGKPLIKLLSITGAAAPVITAVNKIQSGEKYTSEDLTTAIRGIGAGIIAAKSIKNTVGEARLAKSVATKAEESGKSILNTVKSAEVDGIKLERSINDINKFVKANPTEGKAVESIKNILKTQGSEVTDVQAKSLLEGLGIKFDKGKLKLSRKAGIKKAFTTRGENTTNFESPELPTARSTFRYMVNPFTRSKVLGSEAVFGFGKNKGLLKDFVSPQTIAAANRLQLMQGRTPLKVQALNRIAAENPNLFGDMFTFEGKVVSPIIKQYGPYFGGTRYMRMAPVWTTQGPITNSKVQGVADGLQEFSTNIIPSTLRDPNFIRRATMIHDYALPTTRTSVWDKNLWNSAMSGFYRKGGKVIKAQQGTLIKYTDPEWTNPFDKKSRTIITSQSSNGSSNGLLTKEFEGLNFDVIDPNRFIYDRTSKPSVLPINTPTVNPTVKTPDYTSILGKDFTDMKSSKTTNTQLQTDQSKAIRGGGDTLKGYQLNKPNIDDTIRAGITAAGIYQDRNLQRKALGELYKRQFQTPYFSRAKYDFSDIEQGFNESVKPYLEQRFVTSDPRDSMAFKLSKAQQLSSLYGQKNAQVTQRKLQTDDINRQIDTQNENAAVQTANQKSQYYTGLNYQNLMLDSVALNRLFADVINPFGQQMSQQGRDAFNKTASMQYNLDSNALQREEQARINRDFNAYSAAWNALSDDEKRYYGSLQDYVYAIDPEKYKQIITPSDTYNEGMLKAAQSYARATGASMYYKSGGSINIKNTNKNQRSAQEQIAINGHKAAKRSVDELSKALLKMLQQLTK